MGYRIASFVIVETTKISCCSVMAVIVATILTVSVQKWKTFLMVTGEYSTYIWHMYYILVRLNFTTECCNGFSLFQVLSRVYEQSNR